MLVELQDVTASAFRVDVW